MTKIKNSYLNIIKEKEYFTAREKTNQLIAILKEEGFKRSFSGHWTTKTYLRQGDIAKVISAPNIPWFSDNYVVISIDSEEGINSTSPLAQKINKWAE